MNTHRHLFAALETAHRAGYLKQALKRYTRSQLIDLCMWNDPNGCYSDEAMRLEYGHRSSATDLRAIVAQWVIDSTGVAA